MAEAKNLEELYLKRKAISTLLPYATWQELIGQPEMLGVLLYAARASKMLRFVWHQAKQFASVILSNATPQAIILISPHIPWDLLPDRGDLVQQWAAATSRVPYTEEVAQDVVDTLLQIVSMSNLLPHITIDIWSWLTEQPSLPPVCAGRYFGTQQHVVEAVQKLEDIEILKSYLLVTWSEWDTLDGFHEICVLVDENFGGVGMGHHRADLIQRLDHILDQLDQGFEYLIQYNPYFREESFQSMKYQYQRLREELLETHIKTITGGSNPSVVLLCILTQVETHRVSCHVYVCFSSPIVLWLEYLSLMDNTILHPKLHFAITHTAHYTLSHAPIIPQPSYVSSR